jgi:hypothetical protein
MDNAMIRILEMAHKGYNCSQILMLLALEAKGEQNADLVRAVGGLAYGCGTGKGTCGVLTGAACVLALFAGKGSDEEKESDRFLLMLQDLSEWFHEHVGGQYGGVECQAVVGDEGPIASMQTCGAILAETHAKVVDILVANGFDPSTLS